MKIELSQDDIQNALAAYVEQLGLPTEGKYVSVELAAKKGTLSAFVHIESTPPAEKVVGNEAPKVRKPRGPNKAKATTEGAAGTVAGALAGHAGGTVTKEQALAEANAAANAAVNSQTIDPNAAALAEEKQEDAAAKAVTASESKPATTSSLFGDD